MPFAADGFAGEPVGEVTLDLDAGPGLFCIEVGNLRPKLTKRALSMRFIVSLVSLTIKPVIRSDVSTVLICSHFTIESFIAGPSSVAEMLTWVGSGIDPSASVIGATIVCGETLFPLSFWMITQGRIFSISVPSAPRRSTQKTSPRLCRFISSSFLANGSLRRDALGAALALFPSKRPSSSACKRRDQPHSRLQAMLASHLQTDKFIELTTPSWSEKLLDDFAIAYSRSLTPH
jgi:hypothetical protein